MEQKLKQVQEFDASDAFHQHLASLNVRHGRGDVVAIVWGNAPKPVSGTCVCNLQYGQTSFVFRVQHHSNGYTLKAKGRSQSVVSNYFLKSIST